MSQQNPCSDATCPRCGGKAVVTNGSLVCARCGDRGATEDDRSRDVDSVPGEIPVIHTESEHPWERSRRSHHARVHRRRVDSRHWILFSVAVGLLLVVLVGVAWVMSRGLQGGGKGTSSGDVGTNRKPVPPVQNSDLPPFEPPTSSGGTADVGASVADVVESIADAVVLVKVEGETPGQSGLGSGVVVNAEGLIATNYHVVEHAARAVVRFRDGSEYEVVGYRAADPQRDLAILQLREPIPISKFFEVDSSIEIRTGEDTIAIGHPAGFDYTVSTGNVSAIRSTHELPPDFRAWLGTTVDCTWIQTTAAISGGCSGGPLMNAKGQLLGINTWIASGENLGFALHVKHLAEILDGLPPEVRTFPIKGQLGADPLAQPTHPDVADLAKKWGYEFEDFALRLQRAESAEQFVRVIQTDNPTGHYIEQFLQLAERYSGESAALESLVMVCHLSRWGNVSARPLIRQAFDQLLSDYADHPKIKDAVLALLASNHDAAPEFLKKLIQKAKDAELARLARFVLATVLIEQPYASDSGQQQVEALLEEIIAERSDTIVKGQSLVELAKSLLFATRHLRIGRPAVEIEGPDHLGKTMSLSALRGKVVVLYFWADWHPYCRVMYPQQRMLLRDFADCPFALVGVNCDSPAQFRQVMESGAITWPSWSDGQQGPIARQWQLESLPTIFVLDHHGVIRFKDLYDEELQRAVQLLTELAKLEMGAVSHQAAASAEDSGKALVRIHKSLAEMYVAQQEWLAAADQLRAVQETLAARTESDPADRSNKEMLIDSYVTLGVVNLWAGNHAGAVSAFEAALRKLAEMAEGIGDQQMLNKAAKIYLDIAVARNWHGDYQQALIAYQSAVELDPSATNAKTGLARFLATCPLDTWRDGALAVKLATDACETTQWKDFNTIDTLAAALAECGDFESAVQREQQAIELAPREWQSILKRRLDLYEKDEPYREGL